MEPRGIKTQTQLVKNKTDKEIAFHSTANGLPSVFTQTTPEVERKNKKW